MGHVVTIKDVAKRVGKSITTVSRALHGYADISPETQELVRTIANEMGYRPNILAQRLQKQTSDTLGVVLPVFGHGFMDPFFSTFLSGVGNQAAELGYDLLVGFAKEGSEIDSFRKLIEGQRVDGFILLQTLRQDSRVDYLCEGNIPFVAFGRVDGESCFPYIDEDGAWVMEQLSDYLVGLGHHRIACISPSLNFMFASERLRGVRQGLKKHGINLPDEYIRLDSVDQKDGYRETHHLLDLLNPPTAIIAFNDFLAFGAINAAKEKGLVVGKDVSITGFDDIPLSRHFRPPLTTIYQPTFEIGEQVCEMLIQLINGQSLKNRQILKHPSLVIRESCGRVKGN